MIAALEWMAEGLTKNHGINAHVEVIDAEIDLPDEVQLLLFRIAQEALNNIRRHARASEVIVKLEMDNSKIRMTISDNGRGIDLSTQPDDYAKNGKLGIAGMYERARLLGGTLEMKSERGKGTQVIAELPF